MPNKKFVKQLKKSFALQKDQGDCGVACLQNIVRYHGGEVSLEKLRELSGTDKLGTTLLGLYQCASQLGFEAEGAQAEGIENLKEVTHPCILHLTIDNSLQHYVIFYPGTTSLRPSRGEFLVGDPARGLVEYSKEQLEKEWGTKACLLLTPTAQIQQQKQVNKNKWQWFKTILKEDVELLYMAAFLGAIIAVLNLSTAIFSQQLIDKILPKAQYQKLFLGIGLLTLLLLAKSGITYVRSFLLIRQTKQFNVRITGNFYESLLHLPKLFFDNRKTGDLMARLNDTTRIQHAVSYILGDIAIQVLLLFVSILFIFIYSWKIGVLCLIIIPIIFSAVKLFEREILERQHAVMVGYAKNESNYVDSIKGINTIKVLNKENFFATVTKNIFSYFQNTIFNLGKTRMKFNAAAEITTVLFLMSIVLWSSLMVLHKTMTIGGMIAVLQMAGILAQTSIVIALTNIQLQEAKVAFDRMYEFSSLEPEYNRHGDEAEVTVAFEKLVINRLSFRFPGRKQLLRDVSFELNKGEIVTITGESGQGKSTLFQVLQKMYGKENGEIIFNGKDQLEDIGTAAWRSIIGVVPQDITIFSGTLIDNILLGNNINKAQDVIDFCRCYGFHSFFENFPQSYATILGESGVALSGGQKQLVALARCLYHEPQLLLLDEPTAAMDKDTERFVINLLQNLKKKTGILLISHRDSLTKIADRIYNMENGTLQLYSNQVEIREGLYEKL